MYQARARHQGKVAHICVRKTSGKLMNDSDSLKIKV
jgi:hypothetical protein